jgi:ssDNA-binding Zn-finger/Zn-ribbon topoisomerase 1
LTTGTKAYGPERIFKITAKWILEKMKQNITVNDHNMVDQFDEILFKHLKRLIGSRHGIEGLILNTTAISLITLLMERENEIENFASDEIDRYTCDTIIEAIEGMGFYGDRDINVVIEDMIQKNYIHLDSGRLIPQKSATNAAQLMDKVFPKMPGMNLVAYFVQTMDEVKSNRKDIDSAKYQFDQILQIQGIPLKKESPDKEFKTTEILGRKSSDNIYNHSKFSSNEPKVLSPDAYKGKIQITKLNFGGSGLNAADPDIIPPDEHEHIEDKQLETDGIFIETPIHDDNESQHSDAGIMAISEDPSQTVMDDQIQRLDASTPKIPAHDSILSLGDTSCDSKPTEQDESNLYEDKNNFSNTASSQKKNETVEETVEAHPETRFKKEDSVNDDDIEKRITAFEEDLALDCPICRQSKVQVKNTATGKSYYKCSNKDCSFISWGKPHHILCPKCNNPFLIEISNKSGTTSLKCPRATCRYFEKLHPDMPENRKEQMVSAGQDTNTPGSMSQKPRRRVVRRRVVRRKR